MNDMVSPHALVAAVIATSRMLDATYVGNGLCPEAIDRRRWDKIGEELGELAEAYGMFVGENPRKAHTPDLTPTLGELLDIAACALGAWVHLVDTYPDLVSLQADDVLTAFTFQTVSKSRRLAEAIGASAAVRGEEPQRTPETHESDQSRYASECDLCETDGSLHMFDCPNNPRRAASERNNP